MSCSHFYFVSKAVFEATSSCMQQQANHPLLLLCAIPLAARNPVQIVDGKHTHAHTHAHEIVLQLCGVATADAASVCSCFAAKWQLTICFSSCYMHLDLRRHKSGSFLWATFFCFCITPPHWMNVWDDFLYRIHPFLTPKLHLQHFHPFSTPNLHLQHSSLFNP
jgi:hypothetical protein